MPEGTQTSYRGDWETLYYLQDELGSIMKVIGENGKKSAHYNYDEFGRPLGAVKFDQNWPGPDNAIGYTGYTYDYHAGLYYANARYYMPEIGRFISEDPWAGTLAVPNTLNPYPYVLNNPLKYVDPLGLMPLSMIGENRSLKMPMSIIGQSQLLASSNSNKPSYLGSAPAQGTGIGGLSAVENIIVQNIIRQGNPGIGSGLIPDSYMDSNIRPGITPGHAAANRHQLGENLNKFYYEWVYPSELEFALLQLGPVGGIGAFGSKVGGTAKKITSKAINKIDLQLFSKASKSVDDILQGATPGRTTKGRATQYNKSGGYNQAMDDFNSMSPTNVKDIPGGKVGTLPDGRTVNVRNQSSGGQPTLEIYDGKNSIKIRY